MALSSILFTLLLSLALLISVSDASVDDACRAAAASNRSISYDFCLNSLRANPKSESADARGLATIATRLCLDNATNTKAWIDDMIRMGNQMPEITDILKRCSEEVYTNQIALLHGAVHSLRHGRFRDASTKIDMVEDRLHACGDLFSKEGQTDLVAKEESDLEGLSNLGSFFVDSAIRTSRDNEI